MINLAIMGVGRWGRVLIEAVHGQSDIVRFTSAVSRTPDGIRDYCESRGVAVVSSYESVLSDAAIDGVVLTTPHSMHAEQVIAAANAGKPVFCEKPFTLTRESAEKAVSAAESAGIVLAVGHNRRFLPAMQKLKGLVETGELGKIVHIEGNMSGHVGTRYQAGMWRVDPEESPAGGMAGSGIHVIDAMIHLCGPIRAALAQSYRLIHEIEFDDTTSMLFRFVSGATGYLTVMTATAPTFRMQIFGDRGAAELRGEQVLELVSVSGEKTIWEYPAFSTERAQLEAFADAIAGKAPFPISPQDVIAGVAAFEAVPKSAAQRQWVEF